MTATWTSKIPDIIERQLPFTIAETINALARGAAEDARQAATIDLNIKNRALLRSFIRASAKDRATKTRFRARVVVAAPASASPDRGNILAQHEEGGIKTPFRGRSVAMPSRAILKPGKKRQLISGTDLKNFKPFSRDASGRVTGRKGSFLITLKKGRLAGRSMLLQRFGRGKKQVRGLWIFVPQTRLTPKLRFKPSVKKHVQQNVTKAFRAALSRAIATAKPLRGSTQATRL